MPYSKISQLPLVEEMSQMTSPFSTLKSARDASSSGPNLMKALAVSPGALAIHWSMVRAFYQHITLPESLVSMIMYSVAQSNNCQYCSAAHELSCRTWGSTNRP